MTEEQSPDLRHIQVYKMPEHMNKEKRAIQINHFQTYFNLQLIYIHSGLQA